MRERFTETLRAATETGWSHAVRRREYGDQLAH